MYQYTIDELLNRPKKPYIKDKPEYGEYGLVGDYMTPDVDTKISIEVWEEGGGFEVDMVDVIKLICKKFVIDQYGEIHVEFDERLLSIKSSKFKVMLHGVYYKLTGKTIGKEKINSILAVIESHAYTVGEKRYLYN